MPLQLQQTTNVYSIYTFYGLLIKPKFDPFNEQTLFQNIVCCKIKVALYGLKYDVHHNKQGLYVITNVKHNPNKQILLIAQNEKICCRNVMFIKSEQDFKIIYKCLNSFLTEFFLNVCNRRLKNLTEIFSKLNGSQK